MIDPKAWRALADNPNTPEYSLRQIIRSACDRIERLERVVEPIKEWFALSERIRGPEFDMDGPGDQAAFERLMARRRVARHRAKEALAALEQEKADG